MVINEVSKLARKIYPVYPKLLGLGVLVELIVKAYRNKRNNCHFELKVVELWLINLRQSSENMVV